MATTRIKGSGNLQTETRQPGNFTGLALDGFGEATVRRGSSDQITITAEDNILPYITTELRNNTLHIGFERNTSFNTQKGVKYDIQVRDLANIELGGSGNINSAGLPDINAISLGGSGTITVADLRVDLLRVALSGSGGIVAAGQASRLDLSLSGSGNIDAAQLHTHDARVSLSGSGNADLQASENLDISLVGSGNIRYSGDPRVRSSVLGSGHISRR